MILTHIPAAETAEAAAAATNRANTAVIPPPEPEEELCYFAVSAQRLSKTEYSIGWGRSHLWHCRL